MKITAVELSIFELPTNTTLFDLAEIPYGGHNAATAVSGLPSISLHLLTGGSIEGICTVGDVRY